MIGLLGRKVGMTQIYDESGAQVPVTVLAVGPCVVVQKKTRARDGYDALQLGYEDTDAANKAAAGHSKAAGKCFRQLREVRVDGIDSYQVGQAIGVDALAECRRVDVTGVSKGKGFQGVMKRHHFGGGVDTHGSMFHRAPGSIGASSYPSRVVKGKRLPGRMGFERSTSTNLLVVKVDAEKNLLLVRGAVAGPARGLIMVRPSKRKVKVVTAAPAKKKK